MRSLSAGKLRKLFRLKLQIVIPAFWKWIVQDDLKKSPHNRPSGHFINDADINYANYASYLKNPKHSIFNAVRSKLLFLLCEVC